MGTLCPPSSASQQRAARQQPGAHRRAPDGTRSDGPAVDQVLREAASKKKEKLDWRKSIVDLMKDLDLDSSLGARKELAKELVTQANSTARLK